MLQPEHLGNRIRQRRLELGMRQVELARRVGISPSYLNLIEHNRRKIGGKLVIDLAHELDVEPQVLADGVEKALATSLREAAAANLGVLPELDRIEEFAGRFPGWAAFVAAQHGRSVDLERTVQTMNDRLTHEPQVATSLHEVLSSVASIHSAAAILADSQAIEPEWRDRFQRNIFEDSNRLAETSRTLATFLDGAGESDKFLTSPQDEHYVFLERFKHHFPMFETQDAPDIEVFLNGFPELSGKTARALASAHLQRYRKDAVALPLAAFMAAARAFDFDPLTLAREFNSDLASVLRRLSSLPETADTIATGLVICDGAGALTHKKPIDGFNLPRFGPACPLWPLFQALMRPGSLLVSVIEPADGEARFLTYAICEQKLPSNYGDPPIAEATMLVTPLRDGLPVPAATPSQTVGASCSVCVASDCGARREPSILSDGF